MANPREPGNQKQNPNPQDRREQANINDPNRDSDNDGMRKQQQGQQDRQNQQGGRDQQQKPPQQQRPQQR